MGPVGTEKLRSAAAAADAFLTPARQAAESAMMDEMRAGIVWRRGIGRDADYFDAVDRFRASLVAHAKVDASDVVVPPTVVQVRNLSDALAPAIPNLRAAQVRTEAPPPPSVQQVDTLTAAPHGPTAAGVMLAAA